MAKPTRRSFIGSFFGAVAGLATGALKVEALTRRPTKKVVLSRAMLAELSKKPRPCCVERAHLARLKESMALSQQMIENLELLELPIMDLRAEVLKLGVPSPEQRTPEWYLRRWACRTMESKRKLPLQAS